MQLINYELKERPLGIERNEGGGVNIYLAEGVGRELKPITTLTKEETLTLIKVLQSKV